MAVKSYKELIAWQKAMDLAEAIYALTRSFPKEERYGLTSQLRRSAVSVPSNIAEGQARRSTKEFLHHLSIAQGSLGELETQVLLARRFRFLAQEQLNRPLDLLADVGRLLNGLYNSLGR